jgi:broad specificity phosphatase PhoE
MDKDHIVFVRHAESVCGRAQLLNGDPSVPCPLTLKGRLQALRLRWIIRSLEVDLCITTPFRRTQDTARLAVPRRVPVEIWPELADPPAGVLEGRPVHDVLKWLGDNDIRSGPPGAESQYEALQRFSRGLGRLAQVEGVAVVIAHAFPIAVALTIAGGEPPAVRARYDLPIACARPYRVSKARLAAGVDRLRAELNADVSRSPGPPGRSKQHPMR